jgi:predicted transcriptional regulator
MRTTIEMPDDLRAKLLRLAAARGEKGFSHLVQKAVRAFLESEEGREAARKKALVLRGRLSARAADAMAADVAALRERWR